jgi:TolB protein
MRIFPRSPFPSSALGIGLFFAVVSAGSVLAQSAQDTGGLPDADEIVLEVSGTAGSRMRIAVAEFEASDAIDHTARVTVSEMQETLLADLDWSGVFHVMGPQELVVLALNGDRRHDFLQYASLGNKVVLQSRVEVAGGEVVLEGKVYDLASGGFVFGKRYAGDYAEARRIAHSLSDEMVRYFTGTRGIAKTQIAFVSDRDGAGLKELYLMDYDGANQRRISGHQSLSMDPAWSPKNDGLAYVSYFEGPPSLYWADMADGRKTPILVDDTSTAYPNISPDARKIAFARSLKGNWEIFTVPTAGGPAMRLTSSSGIDINPVWSPSGRQIAFSSDRTGTPQIYIMDAEGTNVTRVSRIGRYNEGPAWHPDGTKLLYSHRSDDRSRFDIAMVDLRSHEERILTRGLPGNHEGPSFSPDGRHIVFQSGSGGSDSQIHILNTVTGKIRKLTSVGRNTSPAWSNFFD